ncbi:MAG: TlpA disulfide reductase family protein [Agriterribacter sp.]
MKKFYLFLFVLMMIRQANAQKASATVELKVVGVDEGIISVLLPVQHAVFWGAARVDTIRKNKVHVIALNENQTGFVNINVFNREIKLFVQKGNKIRVTIDEDNTEQPLLIEGNNKEGQMLLTSSNLLYPGSLITRYKTDTTAAMLEKHVEEDKKLRINVFQVLKEQNKIDKVFFDFVQLNMDYYHATLISEVITSRYASTTLPKDNPFYVAVFPNDFGLLWEKIYRQYNVNNPLAIQTFGYSDKFNTYCGDYLNGFLSWQKSRYNIALASSDWAASMKETMQRIQTNMKAPVAEFTEADLLFAELSLEKNYVPLVSFFADFKKRYPQSQYTPYIQPLADKAIAYYKKAKADFTPEQKIVPDYSRVNSFRELMQRFNGKIVYIEFWATWCTTCKDQFDYEKNLHDLLQSKQAEHLFISVDNNNQEEEWKEMIKNFNLRGNHIKANESLIKDLSKIFWKGKGYALPLYIIINAAGNIVEADALPPRDKKKLYQQIGKYL